MYNTVKLPSDFEMDKYGLHVRLVGEEDAEFIVALRTDKKLSRFIHDTDNDIEKQKEWIRKYKKREAEGVDYYFVYSYKGENIGVNRIYDIKDNIGTSGSWICKSGINMEQSIATSMFERDIFFEHLGLVLDKFDVRKENINVQKLHLLFGAQLVGETELDFLYTLSKQNYYLKKQNVMNILRLQ